MAEQLNQLAKEETIDLVVANAENAAKNGRGLTIGALEELYDAGVEIVTLGNHTWDQKEIYNRLDEDGRICRPANFHAHAPGHGYLYCEVNGKKVAVMNLIGRTYMGLYDSPFQKADELLTEIREQTPYIFVDFHAEVTSEKLAFAWYLNGKVSAVLGTHTHVQTADERILQGGTAYITDVGMTGPRDGIIGLKKGPMIQKFIDQLPNKHELEEGPRQFSAVLITVDEAGKSTAIRRIWRSEG